MGDPRVAPRQLTEASRFKRTLLVANYLPGESPTHGTTVLLARLLEGFPKDALFALVAPVGLGEFESLEQSHRMWTYETAVWPMRDGIPARGWHRLGLLTIPLQAARASRLVRENRIEVILALSTSPEMYIPAYLAHRRTGCPLIFYAIDDWQDSGVRVVRWLVDTFVKRILETATLVWALSPAMARELRSVSGREAEVLTHCIDLDAIEGSPSGLSTDAREGFVVGVASSLYWVNIDSFLALLEAISDLRDSGVDARVRLHSPQPSQELARLGVRPSEYLEVAPVPHRDMLRALGDADILFVGLTFDSEPAPKRVAELSFPTKIVEYLASGRPILANAPGYAEVSRYLRENDCGLVVDSPEPSAIGAALRRLSSDPELRSRYAANARATVTRNHDRRKIVAQFLEAFER